MEKRRIEKIPIDLIEDPKDAVRQYIDEEALEELVNSLKTVGFIQPLIVKKKNEHYELIVGHRRLMAAKMANFLTVPCIVSDLSEEEEISYKIHENVVREDVDPVGEAEFLQRAMRKLKLSIPQLAEKIKRSESYVRERLEILNYPQDIREALIQKQISLGVAKYLAQVDNDLARKDYLSFAIRDGLTASLAKRWLQAYQARKMEEIPRAEELKVEIKPAETPPPRRICPLCGTHIDLAELEIADVHRSCLEELNKKLAEITEREEKEREEKEKKIESEIPKEKENL